MFKALFGGRADSVPLAKLPQLNSFVEVIVGGRGVRSVTVESVNERHIVTRESLGCVGENAVLLYVTQEGRFRAETTIASVDSESTQFERPRNVSPVGPTAGPQKRQSVRLDTVVSGGWRFAPGGVGSGEMTKASIRDISRGGCSLIIDRALKLHTMVEVKMQLMNDTVPLVLVGEVMRHEQIKSSGKHSHGLRFHGVHPQEDQAIVEFINRRQADLRNRGLA